MPAFEISTERKIHPNITSLELAVHVYFVSKTKFELLSTWKVIFRLVDQFTCSVLIDQTISLGWPGDEATIAFCHEDTKPSNLKLGKG